MTSTITWVLFWPANTLIMPAPSTATVVVAATSVLGAVQLTVLVAGTVVSAFENAVTKPPPTVCVTVTVTTAARAVAGTAATEAARLFIPVLRSTTRVVPATSLPSTATVLES